MDGNLKARIVTASVGLPLLAWLIGWGAPWLFSLVFLLLTVIALREYFVMVCPDDSWQQARGIIFGCALGITVIVAPVSSIALWLSAFLMVLFAITLWSAESFAERVNRLGWTLLGGLYIGLSLPQVAVLFALDMGRAWVSFVFLVVMAGDSAAYFIGRRFGARKLAPELSPGKTVEGAIAYVIGSVVIGVITAVLLALPVTLFVAAMLALIMSLLGQLGDLFESLIKRAFAVKDSGGLLPGHGGVLDRLDSLIFPVVFATFYLKVIQA